MEIGWTFLAIIFFSLKCQHISCGLFTLFEVTSMLLRKHSTSCFKRINHIELAIGF